VRGIARTLAQVARLSLPYFRSEDRWAGCSLLGAILAIELAHVGIAVLLNAWNARFYDALQHKNAAAFGYELLIFAVLVASFIVLAVYQLYLSQALQIRWRQWMTNRLLATWLQNATPYCMQLTDCVDNPDQRIAEDTKLFVTNTLSLCTGLLGSAVTLISFIVILWGLSNAAPLALFGYPLGVPGYLVWAAIVYAVAGTLITHWIGRPLVDLDIEQQRREADLRAGLLRVRENAEQIALLKGEAAERKRLMACFAKVRVNWTAIMGRQKLLTFFTAGYSQVQVIIPVLAAGPAYFAGAIGLGGLMQTASAFGRVEGALSFFVKAYPQLAQWKSIIERLDGFERGIADVTRRLPSDLEVIACSAESSIRVMALGLQKPDGTPLLSIERLEFAAGEATLVTGRSGTGKSTLLRVLAGIWPHAQGRVAVPTGAHVLVLPQRPYLPEGTLRDAITFPQVMPVEEDARIKALLAEVGLSALAGRLDEQAHWQQRLSLGEQQRLTIVRAILSAPNWLLLDEATASLDEPSERTVYRLLQERLPGTTIVSVGHRSTLRALHSRSIEVSQPHIQAAAA
jgi:vitamin B12/bleomycin/antimicrobial peptide transport system ATP-binding/permease protein